MFQADQLHASDINVNTENHDGAEATLTALASVEVQQAFADANIGGTSYRSGVEAQMPEEYEYVADIINNGNIAFPSDRWSVNLPSQSLFDEFTAQLQGVISGRYQWRRSVKCYLIQKLTQSDMSKL